MGKITTAGELREYLSQTIAGVGNGTINTDKARDITKLAAQINESFYSEIKVAKVVTELGNVASKMGELKINK
jgi:hypothetical protein